MFDKGRVSVGTSWMTGFGKSRVGVDKGHVGVRCVSGWCWVTIGLVLGKGRVGVAKSWVGGCW